MFANIYQKILRTISQWFEIARFPTEPVLIPIKVRMNESRQR